MLDLTNQGTGLVSSSISSDTSMRMSKNWYTVDATVKSTTSFMLGKSSNRTRFISPRTPLFSNWMATPASFVAWVEQYAFMTAQTISAMARCADDELSAPGVAAAVDIASAAAGFPGLFESPSAVPLEPKLKPSMTRWMPTVSFFMACSSRDSCGRSVNMMTTTNKLACWRKSWCKSVRNTSSKAATSAGPIRCLMHAA